MCPWAHFHAYGVKIDGRSRPRWSIRELSYNSPPATTLSSGRFRPAEGVEHVVHVPVGTFSCVWRGNRQSIVAKVVHQKVVVQFASSRHLAEWAISTGRRYQASSTCVRGNIFVRTERNLSVDRARGGLSESCRTSRLQPPLSRVGDFAWRKVSST